METHAQLDGYFIAGLKEFLKKNGNVARKELAYEINARGGRGKVQYIGQVISGERAPSVAFQKIVAEIAGFKNYGDFLEWGKNLLAGEGENTNTLLEHERIIRKFKNKVLATRFNQVLVDIESVDSKHLSTAYRAMSSFLDRLQNTPANGADVRLQEAETEFEVKIGDVELIKELLKELKQNAVTIDRQAQVIDELRRRIEDLEQKIQMTP